MSSGARRSISRQSRRRGWRPHRPRMYIRWGSCYMKCSPGACHSSPPPPTSWRACTARSLPPSPRRFNPSIPIPLEQILLKVLAKEPSARYRTADQLGRVLTALTQQPPAYIQPVAAPGPEPGFSDSTQIASAYPPADEYPPEYAEDEQPGMVVITTPSRPRHSIGSPGCWPYWRWLHWAGSFRSGCGSSICLTHLVKRQ